jgi:hypothetical protein
MKTFTGAEIYANSIFSLKEDKIMGQSSLQLKTSLINKAHETLPLNSNGTFESTELVLHRGSIPAYATQISKTSSG